MERKILIIDAKRCKSCGLCENACPHHCLAISDERNDAGYFQIKMVHAERCVRCGICSLTCPEPLCLTWRNAE